MLDRLQSSPILMFLLPPLFWSGNFVIGRGLNDVLPPIGLAFWRWVTALAILLVVAGPLAWRQRREILAHWKILTVFGVLAVCGYNTFIYLALQTIPTINATVVNSGIPLFIPLFAWLFAREPITVRQGLGLVLSLAGVLWIITRGDFRALASLSFGAGDLWVLLAVVDWAAYSALLRFRPAGLHPLVFLVAIVAIGLVGLAPFYAAEAMTGTPMPATPQSIAVVLYVGACASVLAYICWMRSVALVGPTITGLGVHLMPILAGGFGILFFGEELGPYHVIGAVCILSGIALTSLTGANRPRPQQQSGG